MCFNIFVSYSKGEIVIVMKKIILLGHLIERSWPFKLVPLHFLHLVITNSLRVHHRVVSKSIVDLALFRHETWRLKNISVFVYIVMVV